MIFICLQSEWNFIKYRFNELGQRASNAFDEIADEFDNSAWYRFPNRIKRILPVIMVVIQKPVVIECFGSITCCRDVLKTVSTRILRTRCRNYNRNSFQMVNNIYSYFMILRRFVSWKQWDFELDSLATRASEMKIAHLTPINWSMIMTASHNIKHAIDIISDSSSNFSCCNTLYRCFVVILFQILFKIF